MQIGVIFGLIKLLNELYLVPELTTHVLPLAETLGALPQKGYEDRMTHMTKNLYEIRMKLGRHVFIRNMSNAENFAQYHDQMAILNEKDNAPVKLIAESLISLGHFHSSFSIIDAGCGAATLAKLLFAADSACSFQICCLDALPVNLWNEKYLPALVKKQNANITFEYHGGDYVHYKPHVPANAVVFSLSLSSTVDITSDIEWAHSCLQLHGEIFIVDIAHRFPETFHDTMEQLGYSLSVVCINQAALY